MDPVIHRWTQRFQRRLEKDRQRRHPGIWRGGGRGHRTRHRLRPGDPLYGGSGKAATASSSLPPPPRFLQELLRENFDGFVIDKVYKLNFKLPHAMLITDKNSSKQLVMKGPWVPVLSGSAKRDQSVYLEETWNVYPENPALVVLHKEGLKLHQEFHQWCMDVLAQQTSVPNRDYTRFGDWHKKLVKQKPFQGAPSNLVCKYQFTDYVNSDLYTPDYLPSTWTSFLKVLAMRRMLLCNDTNRTNILAEITTRPHPPPRVLSTDLGRAEELANLPGLTLFTAQQWHKDIYTFLQQAMTREKAAAQQALREAEILVRNAPKQIGIKYGDSRSMRAFQQAAETTDPAEWQRAIQEMLAKKTRTSLTKPTPPSATLPDIPVLPDPSSGLDNDNDNDWVEADDEAEHANRTAFPPPPNEEEIDAPSTFVVEPLLPPPPTIAVQNTIDAPATLLDSPPIVQGKRSMIVAVKADDESDPFVVEDDAYSSSNHSFSSLSRSPVPLPKRSRLDN